MFSSEIILVECSFQISKCSHYFTMISFLKSKFYVLISGSETFYGHFIVNELIRIRLPFGEVYKMKESGSLSRWPRYMIGRGRTRSLVEMIKDFYREIFLDLAGPQLTLFNFGDSDIIYIHREEVLALVASLGCNVVFGLREAFIQSLLWIAILSYDFKAEKLTVPLLKNKLLKGHLGCSIG